MARSGRGPVAVAPTICDGDAHLFADVGAMLGDFLQRRSGAAAGADHAAHLAALSAA